MHVEFHKVIKLIKNNKIYEIFVKIGNRGTFTRLSCFRPVLRYICGNMIFTHSCSKKTCSEFFNSSPALCYGYLKNADTDTRTRTRGHGHADMENADMENADMENTDMENADMENADMENADMENADMENADMENADMENPDMENADMENADKHIKILAW